jgi:hypothetical protein
LKATTPGSVINVKRPQLFLIEFCEDRNYITDAQINDFIETLADNV